MAATVTKVFSFKPGYGGVKEAMFRVTLDSSYPTGGYSMSEISNRMTGTIEQVILPPCVSGYVPEYDYANNRLKMLGKAVSNGLTELDAGTNLSSVTIRFSVRAK